MKHSHLTPINPPHEDKENSHLRKTNLYKKKRRDIANIQRKRQVQLIYEEKIHPFKIKNTACNHEDKEINPPVSQILRTPLDPLWLFPPLQKDFTLCDFPKWYPSAIHGLTLSNVSDKESPKWLQTLNTSKKPKT